MSSNEDDPSIGQSASSPLSDKTASVEPSAPIHSQRSSAIEDAADNDEFQDYINNLKRVKVYELVNARWIDQGTAFCVAEYNDGSNQATLIARAEADYTKTILSSAIRREDVYQRQQDTLIVWTDVDGTDRALSFQDPEGCLEVWNFILEVQRGMQADATNPTDTRGFSIPPDSYIPYLDDEQIIRLPPPHELVPNPPPLPGISHNNSNPTIDYPPLPPPNPTFPIPSAPPPISPVANPIFESAGGMPAKAPPRSALVIKAQISHGISDKVYGAPNHTLVDASEWNEDKGTCCCVVQ